MDGWLGSLFVASYESRGCFGGIRNRLHIFCYTTIAWTAEKTSFPTISLLLRVDSLLCRCVYLAVVWQWISFIVKLFRPSALMSQCKIRVCWRCKGIAFNTNGISKWRYELRKQMQDIHIDRIRLSGLRETSQTPWEILYSKLSLLSDWPLPGRNSHSP
jgi:hypothetical protein